MLAGHWSHCCRVWMKSSDSNKLRTIFKKHVITDINGCRQKDETVPISPWCGTWSNALEKSMRMVSVFERGIKINSQKFIFYFPVCVLHDCGWSSWSRIRVLWLRTLTVWARVTKGISNVVQCSTCSDDCYRAILLCLRLGFEACKVPLAHPRCPFHGVPCLDLAFVVPAWSSE